MHALRYGSLTWSKGWIQHVNINTNIDLGIRNSLFEFVDDPGDTDTVNIPSLYNFKPTSNIISQVGFRSQTRRTYSCMY